MHVWYLYSLICISIRLPRSWIIEKKNSISILLYVNNKISTKIDPKWSLPPCKNPISKRGCCHCGLSRSKFIPSSYSSSIFDLPPELLSFITVLPTQDPHNSLTQWYCLPPALVPFASHQGRLSQIVGYLSHGQISWPPHLYRQGQSDAQCPLVL